MHVQNLEALPEGGRVVEVQLPAGVVLDDPGEDGVLRKVFERPSSLAIQEHQVFKIGYFALYPIPGPLLGALLTVQLYDWLPSEHVVKPGDTYQSGLPQGDPASHFPIGIMHD